MEYESIIKLIDAVSKSDLTTVEVDDGNVKLTFKKEQVCVVKESMDIAPVRVNKEVKVNDDNQNMIVEEIKQPVQSSTMLSEINDDSIKIVKSPIVGTFYSSSSPEEAAFVTVGDKVEKGDTLCILEAMKLMNEIESDFSGTITEVFVKNEDMVEYDQKLFAIKVD